MDRGEIEEVNQQVLAYTFLTTSKQREEVISRVPLLQKNLVDMSNVNPKEKDPRAILDYISEGSIYDIVILEEMEKQNPGSIDIEEKNKAYTQGLDVFINRCIKKVSNGYLHYLDQAFGATFEKMKILGELDIPQSTYQTLNAAYNNGLSKSKGKSVEDILKS